MCCPYRDEAEYHSRLAAFLTESLRNGLRVTCVGGLTTSIAELDRLVAAGTVQVRSVHDVFGPDGPVDPERLIARQAAASEAALADGFRGLAMCADVTDLVRSPAQLDAFARYEFLLDRLIAEHPLSALCGYRLELGDDVVAEFAALHTVGPSGAPAFRVFGCADGALGLGGQFDPVGVAALRRVLTRLGAGVDEGALVVDLAGIENVDHRVLLTLSDYARTTGVALSLQSVPPFATRLMELLPESYLRLAEAAGQT